MVFSKDTEPMIAKATASFVQETQRSRLEAILIIT